MILRFFFIFLLCYVAVKFIFGFVIPVVTATLKMRKKMKEMQGFQQESDGNQPESTASFPRHRKASPSKSDYIDFEEIR